jgi:hypothetical protein
LSISTLVGRLAEPALAVADDSDGAWLGTGTGAVEGAIALPRRHAANAGSRP